MSDLNKILDSDIFDIQTLFQLFRDNDESDSDFELDKFRNFVKKYIKKSYKFEKETGIPRKYFTTKLNLSLLEKSCYHGYSKVKDIYIYFNEENDAIFLKNREEILCIKKKNQKGNWLIPELDKLFDIDKVDKNEDIDENFYLSDNFIVKKSYNFFVRYYLDSLYDIVVKYKNFYYLFFKSENITEYAFAMNSFNKVKIKRMLKINQLELKNILEDD